MIYAIETRRLDELATHIPAAEPVFMLNLIRFKPDGGRELYFGPYVTAFRAIAAELGIVGIEPIWTGQATGFVAGPDGDTWDTILIVRYPNLAAFRAIVESERYRTEALPHRVAAVRDWQLLAQTELARVR